MIRRTMYLIAGTLTGLFAVLYYQPPQLERLSTTGTDLPNTPVNTTPGDGVIAADAPPTQPPAPFLIPTTSETADGHSVPSRTIPAAASQTVTSDDTATPDASTASATSAPATRPPTPKPSPPDTPAPGPQIRQVSFTGDRVNTRYGPFQVVVTIANDKIVDVNVAVFPSGDRRSQMISQQAIPYLREQTLQVQNADVTGVSGASYTSDGYRRSLAAALARAGR